MNSRHKWRLRRYASQCATKSTCALVIFFTLTLICIGLAALHNHFLHVEIRMPQVPKVLAQHHQTKATSPNVTKANVTSSTKKKASGAAACAKAKNIKDCLLEQTRYDAIEALSHPAKTHCNVQRHFGEGERDMRICMDGPYRLVPGDCLVYTFGKRIVDADFSFDESIAKFGCTVYSFDPMCGLEEHKRQWDVSFFPLGLSDKDIDAHKPKLPKAMYPPDSPQANSTWKTRKLSTLHKWLKHEKRKIDVLKIEIESVETVASLRQAINGLVLQKFVKNLVLEWRLCYRCGGPWYTTKHFNDVTALYAKLREAGFVAFFVDARFELKHAFYMVESLVNANMKQK